MQDLNRDTCLRILELPDNPSAMDIKDAYRLLVRVWHPDKYSHDPILQQRAQDKLKQINAAYEWLNMHLSETNSGSTDKTVVPCYPPYNPPSPTYNTARTPSSQSPRIRDYQGFIAALIQYAFGLICLISALGGGIRLILGAYTGSAMVGVLALIFIGGCAYLMFRVGKSNMDKSWY